MIELCRQLEIEQVNIILLIALYTSFKGSFLPNCLDELLILVIKIPSSPEGRIILFLQ